MFIGISQNFRVKKFYEEYVEKNSMMASFFVHLILCRFLIFFNLRFLIMSHHLQVNIEFLTSFKIVYHDYIYRFWFWLEFLFYLLYLVILQFGTTFSWHDQVYIGNAFIMSTGRFSRCRHMILLRKYTSQTICQLFEARMFVCFVQFLSALLRIVHGTITFLIHLFS